MRKTWIGLLLGTVAMLSTAAAPLRADDKAPEASSPESAASGAKISLAEVAPELYFQLRRYPKFYGDPNTVTGPLQDRTQLFGDAGGARDYLVEHGIYADLSITQFLQSNLSGGRDDGRARYNGSADYWLTLDTGKAGLWSGGAVFLHAESSWQADNTLNQDVGTLIPPNFDATMPTPGESESIALPELYAVQALPANVVAIVGKANWAGLADNNVFANNERTQFSDTGLVNNPILGAFIPYTPIGAGLVWAPNKQNTVALVGVQANGDATSTGFDNFNGEYTLGGQYQYSPTLGDDLPGNYRIILGYSNKSILRYDVDERQLIGSIIGTIPAARAQDNYAAFLNFDQYLWVKKDQPAAGRKGLPPVGVGIFGRAGWAPADRNVIDQFYSFGISGVGMLIPGRDNDQWGIGWAGTHISGDLKDDLALLGTNVESFQSAFEAYYNFELTPAAHLTVNAQAIEPTLSSRDTAFTLGARLQIDF